MGSSELLYLGGLDFSPQIGGGIPSAVRVVFDTALTGVDAIRIDFFSGQENGYTGIGEIDVVGTATAPGWLELRS